MNTLTDNHRTIEGNQGWHQHLGSHKIGIVATAIALLLYKRVDKPCPNREGALSFIKKSQNEDGGWPYISNTNGRSNVESTCWALQALYEYSKEDAEIFEKGIHWILTNYNKSNDDEGWPFTKDSTSRIYLTCFVLRTLVKLQQSGSEEFESAKFWLIKSRNEDGGWGELPERESSLFFTSYVISTLLQCGFSSDHYIMQDACHWMTLRMRNLSMEDPSLLCYMEFIESGTDDRRTRIPFFHYVLLHVVIAFLDLGKKNRIVFHAMKTLLYRCASGRIEHPMLEKSNIKPIWALADTATALYRFEHSFANWKDKHLFVAWFNHIFGLGKYNLFRFIAIIPKRVWGFAGPLVIAFWLIYLGYPYFSLKNITEKWEELASNTTGQVVISTLGSVLYGMVTIIWKIGVYLHNRYMESIR